MATSTGNGKSTNGKPMNGSANGVHKPAESGAAGEAPRGTARDRAAASDYEAHHAESSRKPASERENAFNFVAWLAEGMTGVVEELRHNDLGLSEEFWIHATAARNETLLAARAALDSLIEKTSALEKQEQERQERAERRGGINIEF